MLKTWKYLLKLLYVNILSLINEITKQYVLIYSLNALCFISTKCCESDFAMSCRTQ